MRDRHGSRGKIYPEGYELRKKRSRKIPMVLTLVDWDSETAVSSVSVRHRRGDLYPTSEATQ